MVFNYVKADRGQLFLLPVDMREWLPEGHLALFLLDVLAGLDTSALHAGQSEGGPGRPAYDPDVLLAVLFYAYCTGERSSRKVERLCRTDIAFRVLAANTGPDHCTIARFRQAYDAVATAIFVQALGLSAGAGLTKVGLVAIDGTKVGADASMGANVDLAKLGRLVEAMFGEAGAEDETEDRLFGEANGDELPAELHRPHPPGRSPGRGRAPAAGSQDGPGRKGSAGRTGRAERAEQAAAAKRQAPAGRPPRAGKWPEPKKPWPQQRPERPGPAPGPGRRGTCTRPNSAWPKPRPRRPSRGSRPTGPGPPTAASPKPTPPTLTAP